MSPVLLDSHSTWLKRTFTPIALAGCLVAFAVAMPLDATSAPTIIKVPADQPTIQAAIDAAANGYMVVVAPGTYTENINYHGKSIEVNSAQGPSVTTIDGRMLAPVVTFATAEGPASTLRGFTIRNGSSTPDSGYSGGGVRISYASPAIVGNVITANVACDGGGGIDVNFGSPIIQGNTITYNSQSGCSGGIGGGGIAVGGSGSARILDNTIAHNSHGSWGGGTTLFAAGTPTLRNNVISDNNGGQQGGGIWIVNQSDATIVQNLIIRNAAAEGAGIYAGVPSGNRGPFLTNNTFVANVGAVEGSGIYLTGFYAQTQIWNNIVVAGPAASAIDCDSTRSSTPPILRANDAFAADGIAYDGVCAGAAGTNGNISADPQFIDPGNADYHLQVVSPAVVAGDNGAPNIPTQDLDGGVRIADGNENSVAVIDQGAYELPAADSDGDGCPDARESGPGWRAGGQRDPVDPWDFFDVPTPALTTAQHAGERSHAVNLQDVLAVVAYAGTVTGGAPNANGVSYDTDLNANGVPDGREYDRAASAMPSEPWRSGAPNGAVSLQDALVGLNQVGTNCN